MFKNLRDAVISFVTIFVIYGFITSYYLASLGFTYGMSLAYYIFYSLIIYASLGVLTGIIIGFFIQVHRKFTNTKINSSLLNLSFYTVTAVSFFYFIHFSLKLIFGYIVIHTDSFFLKFLAVIIAIGIYTIGLILFYKFIANRKKHISTFLITTLIVLFVVSFSLYSHLGLRTSTMDNKASHVNNVFIISIDTLRPDFLHCYGNDWVRTPTIDSIAKDGILFKNTYASAPYTWPSLSSFLTGKFTINHGVRKNGWRLDTKYLTLTELFKSAGFNTTGVDDLSFRKMGFNQGFDRLLSDNLGILDHQPFRRILFFLPKFSYWFAFHKGYLTTSLRKTLVTYRWLKNINKLNNNFFWFHYYHDSPHSPYTSPEPYFSMYLDPQNNSDFDGSQDFLYRCNKGTQIATKEDISKMKALYAGEITWCDYQIRILIEQLKKMNLYDKSTIVIFSDHGQQFGRRNYFQHGCFIFNETIKIPLIIKPPNDKNFKRNTIIDQPVSIVDIFPTLAELYDIDYSGIKIDGTSLINFLKNGFDQNYCFWNYAETLKYDKAMKPIKEKNKESRVGFSIVNEKWKSILVPELNEYHLYLRSDENEINHIDNPDQIKILANQAVKYFNFKKITDLLKVKDYKTSKKIEEWLEALGYIK